MTGPHLVVVSFRLISRLEVFFCFQKLTENKPTKKERKKERKRKKKEKKKRKKERKQARKEGRKERRKEECPPWGSRRSAPILS